MLFKCFIIFYFFGIQKPQAAHTLAVVHQLQRAYRPTMRNAGESAPDGSELAGPYRRVTLCCYHITSWLFVSAVLEDYADLCPCPRSKWSRAHHKPLFC